MSTTADVVVAGGGPAGWSLAAACADRGLDVVLVDPRPDREWRHTYGLWDHELPADLPTGIVATCARGVAIAGATHDLADAYAVLDTAALHRHLRRHRDGGAVRVRAARSVAVTPGPPGVVLDDGTEVHAPLVADASGAAQSLSRSQQPSRTPSSRVRAGRSSRPAEQTAYGVVLDRDVADRVTGGRLVFMDWRPTHGRPGWPTFLYAVPLDAGRVLLEETSLARRPGLPLPELRERLHARLRAHGLADAEIPAEVPDRSGATERVRFPVDSPRHDPPPGVVAVGAAAPLVHPASGYSLATSLALAPRLAEAVARALDGRDRGVTAVDAARRVVDPPAARVVAGLRRRGLDVLLRMPPTEVPGFFDAFFTMPAHHQRAYLSARDDVGASVAAMTALFSRLPGRARAHLVAGTLLGPGPAAVDG